MKQLLTLVLIIVALSLSAQDGIQFEQGNWESVLKKAKEENKIVFMDAYTSWCGPCKKMSRETFVLPAVGSLYNDNFINVKVNMEKGEGPALAAKYKVKAYPTLLFLNSAGEILHQGLGYHTGEQFLELGEAAKDPDRQLIALQSRWEAGDRSSDFLYNYTRARFDSGLGGFDEVAQEYLKGEQNWATKENMAFNLSFANDVRSKPYRYILDNRASFVEQFSKKTVDAVIEQKIRSEIYEGKGERLSLEQIDLLYKEGLPDQADLMSAKFRVDFYERAGDMAKYIEAATHYLNNFDIQNWNVYNSVAWTLFQNSENKDVLKLASDWTKKSISLDNNAYNNDTLASILYKLNDKKGAKKYAKTAIKLAKAEGIDSDSTEELLVKINAM